MLAIDPKEPRITVRWYNCGCPWITKMCDEQHSSVAKVPVSVLRHYAVENVEKGS